MLPILKKILVLIRQICTRSQASTIEKSLNDIPLSSHSAEGWDFVGELTSSTTPAHSPATTADDNPCESGKRLSSLPAYPIVWAYFIANGYPSPEARRFYKRYQVVGWNSRIIPVLDNWPQLADHWMHSAWQSPRSHNPKSSANDTDPGSDNNPTGPV